MLENFKPEKAVKSESLHEMKERLEMLVNQEKSIRRVDTTEADELLLEIESLKQEISARDTKKITTWYNEENLVVDKKPTIDQKQRVKNELQKIRDRLQ